MTDVLDVLISRVLTRMSVISEQQAHSYDRVSVHGGEHDNQVLSLTDKPMIKYFWDRYRNARTYQARRTVVFAALEALREAVKRTWPDDIEPERGSFAWKCVIADDPRPIKEIQRVYTISRSTVNRYRARYRGVAKTMWVASDD